MNLKIEVLEAFYGDCILISFTDSNDIVRNILIDGGIGRNYSRNLKHRLMKIIDDKQNIDLLIITHIDDDHIGGILKIFEDKELNKNFIRKVWFNSEKNICKKYSSLINNPDDITLMDTINPQTSARQAFTLEKKLKHLNCWEEGLIEVNSKFEKLQFYDIKLTVVSPNFKGIVALGKKLKKEMNRNTYTASKDNDYDRSIYDLQNNNFEEDTSVTNKSSIAFILENKYGNKYLFLGDSHPSDIVNSLKKLGYCENKKIKLEYLKLAHHGSKHNMSESLLRIVDCKKFIISSNGKRDNLPNKETFAKILKYCNHDVELYFNYEIYKDIFSQHEIEKYNIKCFYNNVLEV
ncbi:ComEC/Rec2 family competence protein [Clostridium tyrobutyricum]|uniref:ComEC/Rec2 family competence protein n=1 Tax=Clostridium tyrobutyricum TaxID=1519 RepID=UPI0018A96AF1|nr:MBL fold metallo-hydrolase [Clostridium tyrobutyricum]